MCFEQPCHTSIPSVSRRYPSETPDDRGSAHRPVDPATGRGGRQVDDGSRSSTASTEDDLTGIEVRMVGLPGREPGCTELGMLAGLPAGTTWTLGTTDLPAPLPTDVAAEACRFVGLGGVELAVLDAEGAPGVGALCQELDRGMPVRPMLDPAWSLSTDAITVDGRTITLPLEGGSASATVPFASPEPIVHGRGTWSADGRPVAIGVGCLHGDIWLIGVVLPGQSMWAVMRWDLARDPGVDGITIEGTQPVVLTAAMPLETICAVTEGGHPTIVGSHERGILDSYTDEQVETAGSEAVMLFVVGSGGAVTFEDVAVVLPWLG